MLNSPHHRPTLHAPTHLAALRATVVGLLLLACLCEVAAAEEALPLAAYQDGVVLANRSDESNPAMSSEVTAVRSRLAAPTLLPGTADGGRLSTELAGVTYRWWLTNGRTDLGVGVGTLGYLLTPPDGRLDTPRTLTGAVPTVTLGLRYHVSPHSTGGERHADIEQAAKDVERGLKYTSRASESDAAYHRLRKR